MHFPKEEVKEGAEEFLKVCENTPTPLIIVPLVYKGYKLLKTYFQLRKQISLE